MISVWLARFLGPVVWRLPGRTAKKLFAFALAEDASMRDLTAAASLTPSVERAALYLRHASDEARHTRAFSKRSAELRLAAKGPPLGTPRGDIEHLYEQLGELLFLAFVHHGERRGVAQFELYERYFGARHDARMRDLFAAILIDERRHMSYTWSLLVDVAGSEREARKALRRAVWWEAWRTYRRVGRSVAGAFYKVIMAALYISLTPWALVIRWLRPARIGLVAPSDD